MKYIKKNKWIFIVLVFAIPIGLQFGCSKAAPGQTTHIDEQKGGEISYTSYLIYLPSNYYKKGNSIWPLIIYLHGSGAASSDIQFLRRQALPRLIANNKDFPFIVLCPQSGTQESWKPNKVNSFIETKINRLRIDTKKIYLTGISTGGLATWDTAIEYPEMFAAIAPVAGFCDESKACKLKNVPVWAFHGANDRDASPLFPINMVKAINLCGGKAKITLFPDIAHDCTNETYNNNELYQWFLANHKN